PLLDQKAAERDAPQARLAVINGIENRGISRLGQSGFAGRIDQRLNHRDQSPREGDFNEDQRLSRQCRMEESKAPAIRGQALFEVIPASDDMDRLMRYQALEDVCRR